MSSKKNTDWVEAVIIEDDSEEEVFEIIPKTKDIAPELQPNIFQKRKEIFSNH